MITKFDEYLSDFVGLNFMGTTLDPRYKFSVKDFYFSSIYSDRSSIEIEKGRQVLLKIVSEYEKKLQNSHVSTSLINS